MIGLRPVSVELEHAATVAKNGNLQNLATGLLDIARRVKSMEWEIKVLKQRRKTIPSPLARIRTFEQWLDGYLKERGQIRGDLLSGELLHMERAFDGGRSLK